MIFPLISLLLPLTLIICYFRKQHFATDLERIEVPTVTDSPFIAGQFNCTTAGNETITTIPFNQCNFNTDPEYLNSCTHDAQVRCL